MRNIAETKEYVIAKLRALNVPEPYIDDVAEMVLRLVWEGEMEMLADGLLSAIKGKEKKQ